VLIFRLSPWNGSKKLGKLKTYFSEEAVKITSRGFQEDFKRIMNKQSVLRGT
jgi:hypothetical protein